MPPALSPTANAYLRTKVLSASPEELRLMLLEGAVKFARQGRDALAAKQHEAAYQGISQARDIVFELLTTIRADVDPELASNAKSLYAFIYRTLVDGAHEKDPAKLDQAIDILDYERETWVMLMRQLAAERGVAPARAGAESSSLSVQG